MGREKGQREGTGGRDKEKRQGERQGGKGSREKGTGRRDKEAGRSDKGAERPQWQFAPFVLPCSPV